MTNRPDYDGLIEEMRSLAATTPYGITAHVRKALGRAADALIQSRKDVERLEREKFCLDSNLRAAIQWLVDLGVDSDAFRAILSSVQGIDPPATS